MTTTRGFVQTEQRQSFHSPQHVGILGRCLANVPALMFLGAFTACLLSPLFHRRTFYWGDITLYFEPMQRFARKEFLHGHIPLWNPYLLFGQPFLGNPQMGIFYPTSLFAFLLPSWLFLNLSLMLHLFLCGAFMYAYQRNKKYEPWQSAAGAAVYMGSAFILGRLQFPTMIQTAAYFPLLLFCLDRILYKTTLGMWFALSGTIALTVLAAHAQMALLSFGIGFAYVLMRMCECRKEGEQLKTTYSHFFVQSGILLSSVAFGLMFTMPQVLPTLQLLTLSSREQMTAEMANRFTFESNHLLTLVIPGFFGHPANGDYWGGGNAWEPALFVGWLPLGLGITALWKRFREREILFWAISGGVGLWLAIGRSAGLYQLAFYLVPGVSIFHDPARFLFMTTVSLACLTPAGLKLALSTSHRLTQYSVLLAIALPLWVWGRLWNPSVPSSYFTMSHASLPNPPNTRVYYPAHELYWRRFITDGYSDYGANDSVTLSALRDSELPNIPMNSGTESASAYEPVPILATSDLDGIARLSLKRGDPHASQLLAMMNVGALALPRYAHLYHPDLLPTKHSKRYKEIDWVLNRAVLPRAWLVPKTRFIEGRMRVLAVMTSASFRGKQTAIIESSTIPSNWPSRLIWEPGNQRNIVFAPVRYHQSSSTHLTLIANAGSSPAFLVLAATGYPGWKAEVDGIERKLMRADRAFMGVSLAPGQHIIMFRYLPDTYRVGLFLFLTAVGASAACLTWWLVGRMLNHIGGTGR